MQSIAAGLLLTGGFGGLGVVFELFREISWSTGVQLLAGLLLLAYWTTYCRITVTPWEVRVLGGGWWKSCHCCPLEEAAIWYHWLLPELAARANYYSPCLDFSVEEDWDTGLECVEISFYNEQLFNCFRRQQFPQILHALRTMAEHRIALDQFSDSAAHA